MSDFRKINNITGWLVFLIATAVYVLTIEPTASFWDCGEFIAASYKLQVPHPPGAPFFLLIGRLFSLLASDVTQVAYWVNMVSALSSSFTVLFLFWTITILARKLIIPSQQEGITTGQTIAVIGSGVVGALAYTFSDSFWFSAVEAEVYAMSGVFTAFVFWAMLRWEEVANKPHSDRWLILIAYTMGLSIGVHLLNLVTVPALAYIYYYKKYQTTNKGLLVTFLLSFVIIGVILSGIIPGLPSLAGRVEVLFVNSFGLPFGSGIIFFSVAFIGALVYAIFYSIKKKNPLLNTALLALAFILIGYASYGIIVIRSNYNPPIDENNPENVISFVSYLKREQYGDRPLLYGPQYNATPVRQEKGDALYMKGENKYEIYDYKIINEYDSKDKTLFPRIYSPQGHHIEAYKRWTNLPPDGRKPTFVNNWEFFFKYQVGYMYWRYFMWNFAGRASDIQDATWLAPWDVFEKVPSTIANNKARNNFFMLPLILGIIGLLFQMKRNGKDAFIVGLLFFFTGIAIVIYLNQPPVEPRERDYTFAGSFYAFCIWIGIGVIALWQFFSKLIANSSVRAALVSLLCLGVPGIMAAQGWDDHDRSGRYFSVDSAKNLLNSCAPNAILFTGGDNDTFPLWYVQEVEGFRTDVRVCNLSLLGTDWYIQQMKQQAYKSAPLPISLEYKNFIQGKNDYLPYVENPNVKGGVDLRQYMALVKNEHPAIMVPTQSGGMLTSFPTHNFFLPVDTAKVIQLGFVPANARNNIKSAIQINLSKSALYKSDLLVLDMIANNNWERPIYFSTTLSPSSYLNLQEYFQVEGLAFRLMPVQNQGASEGVVNTQIMSENLLKKFFWRNLDKPLYYDENYRRFPMNSRKSFYRLAEALYMEGKKEEAKAAYTYCFKKMPDSSIPYDVYTPQFIPLMLRLNDEKEAIKMADIMATRAAEELDYYKNVDSRYKNQGEIQMNVIILQQLYLGFKNENRNDLANKYAKLFENYVNMAQQSGPADYGDE